MKPTGTERVGIFFSQLEYTIQIYSEYKKSEFSLSKETHTHTHRSKPNPTEIETQQSLNKQLKNHHKNVERAYGNIHKNENSYNLQKYN